MLYLQIHPLNAGHTMKSKLFIMHSASLRVFKFLVHCVASISEHVFVNKLLTSVTTILTQFVKSVLLCLKFNCLLLLTLRKEKARTLTQ